ncbi:peptide/nickel transport system permease protein [Friedmanniella endophytica]|uniref:Peptide/nickel transport system permease protein n=1 Tax=Microlunatus kandeliicorticis TaxID=1759536 RepID=A0A7W3P437_9ACTN|nr:ABC transporter permease [Microlunatus kandeliicorticis]MBA8792509.1 peptide/nickel transport system permease protein [Microlunatus kandeliicorticis]
MTFARFVLSRLAGMVIVLLAIALISYLIFYLLPANPAQLSCGRPCTPDRLAQAEAFMGLDKPWWAQFLTFLGGFFVGRTFGVGGTAIHCDAPCFGYSFRLSESVTQLIAERAPVTFSIAIGAAVLWLLLGVSTGVASALRRGSLIDRSLTTLSVAGVSAPAYLVGLLGIFLFGFTLNMVPVGGYVPLTQSPVQWLWHLILPWIVLALLNAAIYTRLTRGEMLEVMGEDYIRTARAKGLREGRVVGRHALRNVLIPVATVFGLDLGSLLGGAILTEKVFAMQGLGSLLLDAVGNLDLQVLVGVTLFSAFLIILANVVVDISYGLLDPRVKAGG